MISDDELDDLSDDDEVAFAQYEAIIRASMERSRNAHNWDAERSYTTHMIAFIQTRSIKFTYSAPPGGDADFGEWFTGFLQAIEVVTASLRLRHSARKKRHVNVLTLSLDFKTQIGGHLTAIRKIVFEADHLSESKRDALVRRINNLQYEVDRDRTRTEAAMALWLELTSAISKGATNLDPAIDRLGRIVKVLSLSKDEAETKAIPAPPKPKQIGPPKSVSETEDDDIPF
jgi:hypothetical protein